MAISTSVGQPGLRMLLDIPTLAHAEVFLQLQGESPVDCQGLARDERRLAGTQKRNGIGDIVGRTAPTNRILLLEESQPIRVGLPLRSNTLCQDVTRAYRVHPDPIWPVFRRHLHREL